MGLINVESLGSKGSAIERRPYTKTEVAFLIESGLGSTESAEQIGKNMEEATGIEAHSKLSIGYKLRSIRNWAREKVTKNDKKFNELNEAGDLEGLAGYYLSEHSKKGVKVA